MVGTMDRSIRPILGAFTVFHFRRRILRLSFPPLNPSATPLSPPPLLLLTL